MITLIKKLGIVLILFTAMTCNVKTGNSSSQKSAMKDTLVFVGCQEKIKLEAGSIAELKLEAIQGTGYQWLLKDKPGLVEQIGPDALEYSVPEDKEGMTGAGGFQVLRFRALKTGTEKLQLEYRRTFEGGVEKSCVIEVEVL